MFWEYAVSCASGAEIRYRIRRSFAPTVGLEVLGRYCRTRLHMEGSALHRELLHCTACKMGRGQEERGAVRHSDTIQVTVHLLKCPRVSPHLSKAPPMVHLDERGIGAITIPLRAVLRDPNGASLCRPPITHHRL